MANFTQNGRRISGETIRVIKGASVEVGLWGPINTLAEPHLELNVVSEAMQIANAERSLQAISSNSRKWRITGKSLGIAVIRATTYTQTWDSFKVSVVAPDEVSLIDLVFSGIGRTKKPLGPNDMLLSRLNGVELQFRIPDNIRRKYRNIKPSQWTGPEAKWIDNGSMETSKWEKVMSSQGGQPDDPVTTIYDVPDEIAYWDAPGELNVAAFLISRPIRIFIVQNFTAYITGDPINGGSPRKQLCNPVSWFSIVSMRDINIGLETPSWQRTKENTCELGQADTARPPF